MAKNQGFLPKVDECKNYSAYGAKWLKNFLLSIMRI